MRAITYLLPLAVPLIGLSACSDTPEQHRTEAEEEKAIETLEQVNDMPPALEEITPEPIMYPDMEREDMFGPACSYAPGTSLAARVIAREDDAFLKLDGDIHRLAADPGSRELPAQSRTRYNGRKYSLRLEVREQEGEEASGYHGLVEVRDAWGRVVYSGSGTAQCGNNG